ncbi:MAG: toll/interleukin-1 receptor domain-containing protein, partial [Planctomycetaceae bacterium]
MIFISYRRKDSEDFVVRLQEHLESVFGKELVFRDVGRLEGSQDWQAELDTELGKSLVVLAVIGDRWELAREERVGHPHHGLLRLSLDYDAVRRELELALPQSGEDPGQKKVIPLLINGTEMPSRERLAGLVNTSSRPDLDSIPLVKLATAGAFKLT